MSEKRYGVHDCPNGYYYLRDVTDHSVYVHRNYGKLFSEYEEDIELVSSLLNELADKVDERQTTINKLKEENDRIKTKGLDVLAFYESKLKDAVGTEDFQCVRDEIWIVRQVLYEMGVIDDE